jgi:hypothetical protein
MCLSIRVYVSYCPKACSLDLYPIQGFFSRRKKRETQKSRFSDWPGFSSYQSKISAFLNFQPGPNKLHTHTLTLSSTSVSHRTPDPHSHTPQYAATARCRHRRRKPHAAPTHRHRAPHARTCAVGWPPLRLIWLLPHKLNAVLVEAQPRRTQPRRTSSSGSPSATSFRSSSR